MTVRWCCLAEVFEKIKLCTNPSYFFFLLSKSWQVTVGCFCDVDLFSAAVIIRGI